ncbi:MAG: WD40 repeat domain-containing protein, partial [Nostoc sp.]
MQLAILALLAALLALLFRPEAIAHTAQVNSVRIIDSGTGSSVVSASSDCTLRSWRITTDSLEADENVTLKSKPNEQKPQCVEPREPKGVLAFANNPILVVRFVPVENNSVAIGLENGKIELIKIPTSEIISTLQDSQEQGDKVSDLAFTKDSLNLFSGSGKGKVRVWSRESTTKKFQEKPLVIDLEEQQKLTRFPIWALALSPDDKMLIVSGEFNRFLILSRNQNQPNSPFKNISVERLEKIDGDGRGGEHDSVLSLAFIPDSPEKILATSDSAGLIAIWDLKQCKPTSNNNQQQINDSNCKLLDHWKDESKTRIGTLAFSEDGKFLVSGGDDGR